MYDCLKGVLFCDNWLQLAADSAMLCYDTHKTVMIFSFKCVIVVFAALFILFTSNNEPGDVFNHMLYATSGMGSDMDCDGIPRYDNTEIKVSQIHFLFNEIWHPS